MAEGEGERDRLTMGKTVKIETQRKTKSEQFAVGTNNSNRLLPKSR